MRFYTFILKNVFRRRVRSTLTMTGLAVAVGAVVALVGISDGFKKTVVDSYEKRGVDLIVTRSGGANLLTSTLPEAFGRKIATLPGVAETASGLVEVVSFESMGVYTCPLQGWPLESYMFKEEGIAKPLAGECLSEKFRGKRAIMLGKGLAENLKKKVGDKLSVLEREYTVVAVYETFNPFENSGLVMLLDEAQDLLGKQTQITGVTLRLNTAGVANPDALRDQVKHTIEKDLAAEFHLTKIAALNASDLAKSATQLKAASAMAWLTSAIALLIGSIFVLNTMVMSVFERTREIGILRAIGWRPWRIMRMILMESVLLSLAGGLVGTLGAIGLVWFLSKLPAVGGMVRSEVSGQIILTGFIIALVVGLIGAAYPAYRGARLLPTEALRHE